MMMDGARGEKPLFFRVVDVRKGVYNIYLFFFNTHIFITYVHHTSSATQLYHLQLAVILSDDESESSVRTQIFKEEEERSRSTKECRSFEEESAGKEKKVGGRSGETRRGDDDDDEDGNDDGVRSVKTVRNKETSSKDGTVWST